MATHIVFPNVEIPGKHSGPYGHVKCETPSPAKILSKAITTGGVATHAGLPGLMAE